MCQSLPPPPPILSLILLLVSHFPPIIIFDFSSFLFQQQQQKYQKGERRAAKLQKRRRRTRSSRSHLPFPRAYNCSDDVCGGGGGSVTLCGRREESGNTLVKRDGEGVWVQDEETLSNVKPLSLSLSFLLQWCVA